MNLFTRSLWPRHVRSPYLRLCLAIVAGPFLIASLLTLAAFLLAGMSEPTRERVMAVTLDAGVAMFSLSYGYMLTFGLVGIMMLWALAQRGILAWAVAGAVTGVIAGMLFGEVLMGGADRGLLIAFAFGGWLLFIAIRRLAGVQDDDTASN